MLTLFSASLGSAPAAGSGVAGKFDTLSKGTLVA